MASNRTPFDIYSSVLSVCYTYSALGLLAVCCNLFVLLVYISKSSIRTRYVLFCFIALADLINGLGFLMTGIKRSFKIWALNNSTELPITYRYQCALEFNTTFMLVGSQWPALLIFILGVERFVAVTFPRQYVEISKHYLSISLTSLVLVTFSLFLALFMGIILQRNDLGAYLCTMTTSYGWEYSTFHYIFIAFGHLFGFLLNLVALLIAIRASTKVCIQKAKYQKEMVKIRLIFMISLCSVVFVVVPNVILYLARWMNLNNVLLGWIYCAFALRSCFNVFVIGFANGEFKNRVYEIFKLNWSMLGKIDAIPLRGVTVFNRRKPASHRPARTISVAPIRRTNSF